MKWFCKCVQNLELISHKEQEGFDKIIYTTLVLKCLDCGKIKEVEYREV